MIRITHLSVPAQYSPDDAVAIYRALLFFLLVFGAMLLAHKWDEKREQENDAAQKKDARRRIREFQTSQRQRRG